MASPEEAFDDYYWPEIEGRRTRRTRFRFREATEGDVTGTDPRRYVLEVIDGDARMAHPMTELDLRGLWHVTTHTITGRQMPVEDNQDTY